jgi:type I restriction enzyme S subunit
MRKGWEMKKLGEVCIVERGSSPRPIEKFITNSDDGVNWIKIGDTKGVDKFIFSTKEKITREGAEKSRFVKKGDFILSNSMSFGKPFIMQTEGYIHDGWFVFRLPNYIDKDYFYYLLSSPNVQKQIQSLGAGAIVKNISGDLVKKVDIKYPTSLSEQQRIVSTLDKCFTAIDQAKYIAEQNLKNSKELFKSYLQSIKAVKHSLGSLVDIKTGKLNSNAAVEGGIYPFFTCSREIFAINNYAFDFEAVLLAGNNASGDFNVKHYKGKFNAYQRTYVITVSKENKLLYRYLYFQLLNSLKEFKEKSVGANTRFLKLGMIQEIKIPLPNVDEQKNIVQKLDELELETQKLVNQYQKKLNDLEDLKKSILIKAFSGEL